MQKTRPQPLAVLVTLAFHAIQRPIHPAAGPLRRHIEQKHAIRHQALGRYPPDLPNLLGVESARMSLVYDIGEKVPVRNHNLAAVQRRSNDLLHKLRPGRHVEQHLAAASDRRAGIACQQNFPNALAQRRAPRIAANDDIMPARTQLLLEQTNLRRFANSIDSVE